MLYMSIKYARRTVRIYAYAYVHNHIRITCMLYADSTLRLSRVRACVQTCVDVSDVASMLPHVVASVRQSAGRRCAGAQVRRFGREDVG